MQTLGNMPEVGIYPQNRRNIERCTYKNAWVWIYKVESWRWIGRVIEFPCLDNGSIPPTMAGNSISSACSTPLDGINSTLKSWFAPRLVVIIPSFRCVDIFRTRSSKERSMGKEGRTTPISSRLFYSSCFFTAALTDAGNHDLEIPLRKDHEERKEDPSFSVHCPPSSSSSTPFSLYYMYIFFSTPLFLRYFFRPWCSNWVKLQRRI